MASKRKYGYYIKGNKIAIIEEGLGSGLCSISGYSSQTTCEDAGGTWTANGISTDDGEYRSPVATVADGLEIQYAYSPTYKLPDIQVQSSSASNRTKFFVNGWIVVDDYLTLAKSGIIWSNSTKVDVDDYIYIGGSQRWNGIHKIQEIQDFGDVTHGGVKTYTKVKSGSSVYTDSSCSWVDDETITGLSADGVDASFVNKATTPYLWISGSDASQHNNGMFSGWTTSTLSTVLDLSEAIRYKFSSATITEDELTPTFTADASEDIYIYKAYHDPSTYFITDVDVMDDESFDLDLPRYQANAIVYYLKAQLAEDRGDMEQREFFMREFKRQLEKGNSSKKRGPHIIQGFKGML